MKRRIVSFALSGLFCVCLVVGCVGGGQSQKASSWKVTRLQIQRPPVFPGLCTKRPKSTRYLLLFSSRWCTHCHEMMRVLQRESQQLRVWRIRPVLLWTDAKSCLDARRLGAHFPEWSFGHPTAQEAQDWAVRYTPVMYLIVQQKPVLRIDGAMSRKALLRALSGVLGPMR